MGVFDTVWVTCPYCSEITDLQSKAGNCTLSNYGLSDAPLSILGDLSEGGGWRECSHCKEKIEIAVTERPKFSVVKSKINKNGEWE